MSGYGGFERMLARILGRAPGLKAVAKQWYATANHLLFAERNFTLALATGVRVERAFGGRDQGDRCFVGYFEPSPFSASDARLLHHRRRPGAEEIDVVVQGEDTRTIASTSAFSSQQGARLHWVPGTSDVCVYNCWHDGALASCWHDVVTDARDFERHPIATLAPDGRRYATLDYLGLASVAPDYGYAMPSSDAAPSHAGAHSGDARSQRIELRTRDAEEAEAVCELERVVGLAPEPDMRDATHELNHVSFAPDGDSLVFIHRWTGSAGRRSRLLRWRPDDGGLSVVIEAGMVSHFGWLPSGGLVTWARIGGDEAYHLLDDALAPLRILGPGTLDAWGDGHPSVRSDGRLLVTDSYPDRRRQQHLLLHDLERDRTLELGRFLAPVRYSGIDRVDLHPRWSNDGRRVCVDSTHGGGPGVYVLDVGDAIDAWLEDRP